MKRVTKGYGFLSNRPVVETWVIPAALISGAFLGATLVPFFLSWLTIFPLAFVMFLVAREHSPRLAFRTAFFAGLSWWTIHLFWLPQAFATFLNPQIVWVVIPLIWPVQALIGAIPAYLAHWLGRRPVPTLAILACGWLLTEYWRAWYGSQIAFPWGMFGYSLINTPLAQIASLGGIWLVSLLVLGFSASLAALAWVEIRPLVLMLILCISSFTYGLTRPVLPMANQSALLVQGNIDPIKRFKTGTTGDLKTYDKLSRNASLSTLVVWPEAAVSLDDALQTSVPKLVTGAYTFNGLTRSNLVVALKLAPLKNLTRISRLHKLPQNSFFKSRELNREIGRSSKVRFVPFGETFPLRDMLHFVYAPIFQGLGLGSEFGRGDPEAHLGQRLLQVDADQIGAYVCYDSGFPEITRNLVRLGANVLTESTNDGWFGGGTGNLQHFIIDRMRAIETDRFILRAANTGVTALIDARGQIVKQLKLNQAAALPVQYARLETRTLYVVLGDWVIGITILLILLISFLVRRNQNRLL